jgi:hypothetical protein
LNLRISLAWSGVWGNILWSTEDLESWISLDTHALAEFALLCAVNLGELDVLFLQACGGFLVFWGKSFAVSTPRLLKEGTISRLR